MANTDIKFNVNVDQALANLKKIEDKLSSIGDKFSVFDRLTNSVMAFGAAITAAGVGVAAFADEITDIAAANDMAVSGVLALNKALAESGGKAENAGRLLQTLSNNVEEANAGNLKTLSSFQRLGVSLEDLGTLSQSEIKDKLLTSLAGIRDPMERNALAAQFFGKALLGVDIAKFAERQKQLQAEMERFTPAVQAAGDAWDNMVYIIGQLKLAFAEAFQPVFNIIGKIKLDTDALVIGFRAMAAALVVMTGAAVLGGLLKLVEIMKTLTVVVSKNPLVTIAAALASAGVGIASYIGLTKSAEQAQKDFNKESNKTVETTQRGRRDQSGITDAIQKQIDSLKQVRAGLEANWKLASDRYKLELETIGLSEEAK